MFFCFPATEAGCFNPLPSPKQGETHKSVGSKLAKAVAFQSAPLTEARGDISAFLSKRRQRDVSIRSPHRSKGRHACFDCGKVIRGCFNPLPSPKQGETRAVAELIAKVGEVSIRSPHRSKGRPGGWPTDPGLSINVSIRSPHRSKGRPRILWGDDDDDLRRFNPLPSPKQGETIKLPLCRPCDTSVSIRSPHRSKGRRWDADRDWRLLVSIRSPHRSKGRPAHSYVVLT